MEPEPAPKLAARPAGVVPFATAVHLARKQATSEGEDRVLAQAPSRPSQLRPGILEHFFGDLEERPHPLRILAIVLGKQLYQLQRRIQSCRHGDSLRVLVWFCRLLVPEPEPEPDPDPDPVSASASALVKRVSIATIRAPVKRDLL